MKKKFIIQDWAGNICFHGQEFDSFEDAWGFIFEKFPDENCFDDYFVIESRGVTARRYLDPKDPRGGLKVS